MSGTLVCIEAEQLIRGRGEPVRDAVVLLDGNQITYAGERKQAPPYPSAAAHRVNTVMPGLWDCHAHFIGLRDLEIEKVIREPQLLHMARACRGAADVLQAGFTSVREVGGYGVFLASAIAEGILAGPNIYGAGSILSQTCGHGDLHRVPISSVCDFAKHDGWLQLCDGVAECQKAVRLQLRKNARLIKLCASGGVLTELDHPIHQQFSDAELRTIVEEAARADRIVAAHCHGKPGIMAALRAGCRTIEHGTYLDEEAAHAMREANAILVSTRAPYGRVAAALDKVPPFVAVKVRAMMDRHYESMLIARKVGVTIACGKDFLTIGDDSISPMGRNGEELAHLVDVGYTPLQAIEAATANAPLTLGPQAPKSGVLEPGYDADVIALDVDPLADIRALSNPSHVTHVWKGGQCVKAPAASGVH